MLLDFNLPYVGALLANALDERQRRLKVRLLHVFHAMEDEEEALCRGMVCLVLLLRFRSLVEHLLHYAVLMGKPTLIEFFLSEGTD